MHKLKIGSLFTGIGGFDLGFENAGFETLWQVEIDNNCLNLLGQKFPKVEKFKDIRIVKKRNLKPVDIITGGFPCQDLSVAGKRAGLAGKRSGLWFEFERVIDELKPGGFVIENVPGLLSSAGGRDLGTIIRDLVKRGYCVAWRVLNAQYFGVAQRRRRMFLVGYYGDGRAARILFESESCSWNTPASEKARRKLFDKIYGETSGRPSHGLAREQRSEGAKTLPALRIALRSQQTLYQALDCLQGLWLRCLGSRKPLNFRSLRYLLSVG